MKEQKIPFNIPYLAGKEEIYVIQSIQSRAHCGGREFTNKCISFLKDKYGFGETFLTPSCTAALEMGALLADVGPGDEVILPSYTFSSTANAIVLRGAKPVFCEVEPNTMNIDVKFLPSLITNKTKMIVPIDYAGIPCDIDPILEIAKEKNIIVMVDSAQSLNSYYRGRPCGVGPDLVAFSFHETKNITCGEGGALVVNRPEWVERAHFIQEKGTDRKLVLDGVKSKYHWVDIGSSFVLSDILAAMLYAQLEQIDEITQIRGKITEAYTNMLKSFEENKHITYTHAPEYVKINNHAFFIILDTKENRAEFISKLKEKNVSAYIGYVPLHSSPMGQRLGYRADDLPITEDLASRIVRLPFYPELVSDGLEYTLDTIKNTLSSMYQAK